MVPRDEQPSKPALTATRRRSPDHTGVATTAPDTTSTDTGDLAREFEDPEGLRVLLERLHRAGAGAWRHDAEAAELMRFCSHRYSPLAIKYGLDRDDAAFAAFETMRNRSTRTAADPWAVVTHAVRITLIAEHRAHGLLTSTQRARRARYNQFHDPERFSDRDTDLAAWHPSLRTPDPADAHHETDTERGPAAQALEDAVAFLTLLGWAPDIARDALGHVVTRLIDADDRQQAAATLHRDRVVPVLLGLTRGSWNVLVRVLLGSPTSPQLDLRTGLLARLLAGDSVRQLLHDDDLVRAAVGPLSTRAGVDS